MGHRVAPGARLDLAEPWHYVASDRSVETADRLIDSITARFFLLGNHPQAGSRRDELRPGLRSFPIGAYVVLYRIEGSDVLIQHVTRGSRDLESLLGE